MKGDVYRLVSYSISCSYFKHARADINTDSDNATAPVLKNLCSRSTADIDYLVSSLHAREFRSKLPEVS